jgi:hypothetical protein
MVMKRIERVRIFRIAKKRLHVPIGNRIGVGAFVHSACTYNYLHLGSLYPIALAVEK